MTSLMRPFTAPTPMLITGYGAILSGIPELLIHQFFRNRPGQPLATHPRLSPN